MKRMAEWMERLRGERAAVKAICDSMDDGALARRMRTAAVRIQPDGRARLALPNGIVRELEEAEVRAQGLRKLCSERFAPLEILIRDLRQMCSCADRARAERVEFLPAADGKTRIELVVEQLCAEGDVQLNQERLLLGIASFDDVQPMEMAELWAVPEALRVHLCRAYARTAKAVLEVAEERRRAEFWVDSGEMPARRTPAFYEHALRMIAEREESERRAQLEDAIAESGIALEQSVQLAHGRESLLRMRLENLMSARRMIDRLDWQRCFAEVSAVERELEFDPAEIYANMEEDSKAAVRRELALLARRLNLSELTLARHAVGLARRAVEEGEVRARQTVCFWLYEDEGRRELARRVGAADAILPKMVPDPTGRGSVALIAVLFGALFAAYLGVVRNLWFVLMGIPLAWGVAMAVLGRVFSSFVRPAKLLKLRMDSVPDDRRTLVVMPVLLSSLVRAAEICDQFESLGCLETDENIRYLLLGDFADADSAEQTGDDEIVEFVKARVEGMNERLGRRQFFYLHRGRSFLAQDDKWMGRDRKRGALMDLNRLLLGVSGAEEAFQAEDGACSAVKGRFRYVLTLDADTRFLPGAVQRLIGTLAHPLNELRLDRGVRKGYAVLQPQMEMTASACVNDFVRLFAGIGGLNIYPASVSSYWQDVTGTGLFGGKGLYDVRAFFDALDGALPEGRILSHDLIEGTLAGAAQVSDVCFYDGYPATMGSFLKRQHRWIRGDWQLLPVLLSGKKYPPDQRRLSAAERLRLADNLLTSLWSPALLGLLIQAVWMGHGGALALGLILGIRTPILYLFGNDRLKWRRAAAELAMLPARAGCAVDAIVRTLWRLVISKRHLLDWMTSADAEGRPSGFMRSNFIAAILMIPGLLVPGGALAALALGMLFWIGPGWIRDMENATLAGQALSGADRKLLMELAKDTWRFFEMSVAEQGHFLPPDNVQVDPPIGAAQRTSPTNIGLYLMSCAAAKELGLIDGEEMRQRMSDTVQTLQKMEKWKGQLYNWYDILTLQPLHPRYVSSVDSGNLAAALMMCASAVDAFPDLAAQMRALAENMDLAALYDPERRLFRIGADVERGTLSESHYDLLASESRILSYTAIMLGQAPVKHWTALGRPGVQSQEGASLLSWSGTMFEYLMPAIFMRAPENSLLGQTMRSAVRMQETFGEQRNRPWGISESGYYAFDLHLNYQYRAFGLSRLSLGGEAPQDVVAPYATALAAMIDPKRAVKNLERMIELGWRGECGFYEAADYLQAEADGRARLVKSFMAHHQGMALCALCNVLTDGSMNRWFGSIPEARAIELLLEERPLETIRGRTAAKGRMQQVRAELSGSGERAARPDQRLVDAHVLGGAGATAVLTADGMVYYERHGVQATRFGGDFLNRSDGACVHIRRERTGECAILAERTRYFPGGAVMRCELKSVQCEMQMCVSPEDGTLYKKIILKNTSDAVETLRVADCVPVSLGTPAEMRAHPAFRHLFIESSRPQHCALMFHRRPREEGEQTPVLMHLVNAPGEVLCETDLERLTGRMGSTMRPNGIEWKMTGRIGVVLDPCSALQAIVTVAPHQRVEMHFAMNLVEREEADAWMERSFQESAPERALQLAAMQAQTTLGFIGLSVRQAHGLYRLAALMLDRRLAAPAEAHFGETEAVGRSVLWSLGISGDLPILLLRVDDRSQMPVVKESIRAHELYRTLGLRTDLVLINGQEVGYVRPVHDSVSDVIAYSHLGELRGVSGGVHLLDATQLTEEQCIALERAAALSASASQDWDASVRSTLSVLNRPKQETREMLPGENRLPPVKVMDGNGFGGFLSDGRYAVDVLPERTTPAPWSNQMANEAFGVLLTERGGGFIWSGSSRMGRLTAFSNDVLKEGWGWMLYLVNEESGEFLRLLPGERPQMAFRVIYSPTETIYRFENSKLAGEIALCVRRDAPELRIHATVRSTVGGRYRLVGFVDWLMGTDTSDAGFLRTWSRDGAGFAVGAMDGVGYFAAANARASTGCSRVNFLGHGSIQCPEGIADGIERAGGWVLNVPVQLRTDVPSRTDWVIGAAQTKQQAYACVRGFYARPDYEAVRMRALGEWRRKSGQMVVETPDRAVNEMANGWLLHQTLTARVRARTGLYQPGGAFGFRDQLQDMLAVLPFDSQRVREHILRCAAHQFEDGDVMHWWHEPFLGVRTHISDDMLFLPYVTAKYIRWTQDAAILDEQVRYLENVEIEPGKEDVYCEMRSGALRESLHAHCMRAFKRAAVTGVHGLVRMGSGDWNDGMNRIGHRGRGESVWLTEFLSVCAEEYAPLVRDSTERDWLIGLADRMKAAVEAFGWDGEWYLRAYDDDGAAIGSGANETCRIDAISQAWAVLAGLDPVRCAQAMDSAWQMLVDEQIGILRLLTPPFDGKEFDPGYISGYPKGVRENGAQYTHAACWLLLAMIHMGDADRSHRALKMLLPQSHADTMEKAKRYRVEPYVLAADIYDGEHPGRGGWTWYTGSAAWLYLCILEMLGFERQGNRVRVCALLGDWLEVAVTVQCGDARYRLVCRQDAAEITLDGKAVPGDWIEMKDDGCEHEAVFPPRKTALAIPN